MLQFTPLLDAVNNPSDLKKLDPTVLEEFCRELRHETIQSVAGNGGFLGSNLAVVELTTALHYVFNAPHDKIIWDVGHQSYPHKIITERRTSMASLGQRDGCDMFTNPLESPYDAVSGSGRPGHGVSQAVGIASARLMNDQDYQVVCVFGDRSMSAGQVFEAINFSGNIPSKIIYILNDNTSDAKPINSGLDAYLNALTERSKAKNTDESAHLFEELGIRYEGPIDGHDVNKLVQFLTRLRDDPEESPVLLHIKTTKGKGYAPAEAAKDSLHDVNQFNLNNGIQSRKMQGPSWMRFVVDKLTKLAEQDDRVCIVSTDHPHKVSFNTFNKRFPNRIFYFDAANQHAISFAAGLARMGLKPYVALSSSFLETAISQLIHDVAHENLDVKLLLDQSGFVGRMSPHHLGIFDLGLMQSVPHISAYSPADIGDLETVLNESLHSNESLCIRLSSIMGTALPLFEPIQQETPAYPTGRYLRHGTMICFITHGGRVADAVKASDMLRGYGISSSVIDMRYIKPLDTAILKHAFQNHHYILTLGDAPLTGFSTLVDTEILHWHKDTHLPIPVIEHLDAPLAFVAQDHFVKQLQTYNQSPIKLRDYVLSWLGDREDLHHAVNDE